MEINAVMIMMESLLLGLLEVALLIVFLLVMRKKIITFWKMCYHGFIVVMDCSLTVVTRIIDFDHLMMDPATIHHLLVRNVTNCIICSSYVCVYSLCFW